MTNPLDNPQDYVLIAGRRTPGLCEIVGASSPRNWEEISGAGWSGGLLVYRGIKLSHFSIRLSLYDTRDWNDWFAFRPLVQKRPAIGGGIPRTLDCVHPFLNDLGITALVIEDVRAPDQVGHGVWMIELQCIESRKLKADAGAANGSEATTTDPLTAAVEREKKENDKLADEGNDLIDRLNAQ